MKYFDRASYSAYFMQPIYTRRIEGGFCPMKEAALPYVKSNTNLDVELLFAAHYNGYDLQNMAKEMSENRKGGVLLSSSNIYEAIQISAYTCASIKRMNLTKKFEDGHDTFFLADDIRPDKRGIDKSQLLLIASLEDLPKAAGYAGVLISDADGYDPIFVANCIEDLRTENLTLPIFIWKAKESTKDDWDELLMRRLVINENFSRVILEKPQDEYYLGFLVTRAQHYGILIPETFDVYSLIQNLKDVIGVNFSEIDIDKFLRLVKAKLAQDSMTIEEALSIKREDFDDMSRKDYPSKSSGFYCNDTNESEDEIDPFDEYTVAPSTGDETFFVTDFSAHNPFDDCSGRFGLSPSEESSDTDGLIPVIDVQEKDGEYFDVLTGEKIEFDHIKDFFCGECQF